MTDNTRALANKLSEARKLIDQAEATLGTLSDGQRRDLLMDNTRWTRDEIVTLVAALCFERVED